MLIRPQSTVLKKKKKKGKREKGIGNRGVIAYSFAATFLLISSTTLSKSDNIT